jgi:hypothetical protein
MRRCALRLGDWAKVFKRDLESETDSAKRVRITP